MCVARRAAYDSFFRTKDADDWASFDDATLTRLASCADASRVAYMDQADVRRVMEANDPPFDRTAEDVSLRYIAASDPGEDTNAFAWVDRSARVAYVAFRGTASGEDVLTDLDVRGRRLRLVADARVHCGFLRQFRAVEHELTRYLTRAAPDVDELQFTGHSLGGALATLAAAYYAYLDHDACLPVRAHARNPKPPPAKHSKHTLRSKTISCHTFGSPRVGSRDFARAVEGRVSHVRVARYDDVVPMVPASWLYEHVAARGMRLGEAPGDARPLVGARARDVHWALRPLDVLMRANFADPVGAHDVGGYATRVRGLQRVSRSARLRTDAAAAPRNVLRRL